MKSLIISVFTFTRPARVMAGGHIESFVLYLMLGEVFVHTREYLVDHGWALARNSFGDDRRAWEANPNGLYQLLERSQE